MKNTTPERRVMLLQYDEQQHRLIFAPDPDSKMWRFHLSDSWGKRLVPHTPAFSDRQLIRWAINVVVSSEGKKKLPIPFDYEESRIILRRKVVRSPNLVAAIEKFRKSENFSIPAKIPKVLSTEHGFALLVQGQILFYDSRVKMRSWRFMSEAMSFDVAMEFAGHILRDRLTKQRAPVYHVPWFPESLAYAVESFSELPDPLDQHHIPPINAPGKAERESPIVTALEDAGTNLGVEEKQLASERMALIAGLCERLPSDRFGRLVQELLRLYLNQLRDAGIEQAPLRFRVLSGRRQRLDELKAEVLTMEAEVSSASEEAASLSEECRAFESVLVERRAAARNRLTALFNQLLGEWRARNGRTGEIAAPDANSAKDVEQLQSELNEKSAQLALATQQNDVAKKTLEATREQIARFLQ